MKKIMAIAIVAFAAFGASSAFAADCSAPVSVDCTNGQDENGRDIHCDVYVNTDATGEQCVQA